MMDFDAYMVIKNALVFMNENGILIEMQNSVKTEIKQ